MNRPTHNAKCPGCGGQYAPEDGDCCVQCDECDGATNWAHDRGDRVLCTGCDERAEMEDRIAKAEAYEAQAEDAWKARLEDDDTDNRADDGAPTAGTAGTKG